jgi:hypothetical protein
MITMFLLMTTNTMTPLLESNMKLMSHTGGLYNILRYEINIKDGDDSGGNDDKYIPFNATVTSYAAASIPVVHSCLALNTAQHRRAVRQPPIRQELTKKNFPSKPLVQEDHVVEAPAAVHDGVPDVHIDEVQDAQEVYHPVDAWQDGQAVEVHDDVPTGGRDDHDQGRLVENMTKDVEPNGGSAKPKRSPKLNPQYNPDNYDLSNVGDKSETRSRRSIQPPIQDDPAHEAPTVGHGGVPAIRAEGVHGDLEDAGQEGHDAGNVRDDVQTAGGDTPDQGRQNEGAR